jgi:hypothetical protein
MREPNEHGVYEPDTTCELARCGRSYASITLATCRDGLVRYAIHLHYSYGGMGGPIKDYSEGYASQAAAQDAGIAELLRCFPKWWPSEPSSVRDELEILKRMVEDKLRQPSLF